MIETPLERQLRAALGAQAAGLPADAAAGLLARGYRPRTRIRTTAWVLVAVGLLAGAAFVVSLVGIGTSAPRAFAGWSRIPTSATAGQVSRATKVCRSGLTTMASRSRQTVAHPGAEGPVLPRNGWKAVLADTRGPYTIIVLEANSGRAVATCFIGRHRPGSIGAAVGVHVPPPVPSGRVEYASSGSTTTPREEGSHQFSQVVGRTGAGVIGVRIRLNDGTRVTASCANGWFLAWWPGSHGLRATEVMTADGTHVH